MSLVPVVIHQLLLSTPPPRTSDDSVRGVRTVSKDFLRFASFMMRSLKIILLLALCIAKQASSELDNVRKLTSANNEFAFKLQKTLNSQGNAFISPVSIFTALAMLYQGARGVTAKELHQVLSFSAAGLNGQNVAPNFEELLAVLNNHSGEYKLAVANLLLSQFGIPLEQSYRDTLRRHYSAEVTDVNFETESSRIVKEVNNWVKNKTQGKIQNLLSSLSKDTVLMLLNAVYFKGIWEKQFLPKGTREETFYNGGVNRVPVQMMVTKDDFLYGDFKQYGVQALKLPYKGKDISMLLVLPIDRRGLSKVEQELTAAKLQDINSQLRKEEVLVNIPKFKLEDQTELKENLIKLGMRSAFVDGANFGGIARQGNLKVSKVVHKAVIEVNEEGSEAASSVAIFVVPYSLQFDPKKFRADHPFLFFIRDNRTGMILFSGRVNDL